MGKRKKRTDPDRLAHEARVEEHLRIVYEKIDRYFEEIGEPRPVDSLAWLEQKEAKRRAAQG
jgi:hypothetical protein